MLEECRLLKLEQRNVLEFSETPYCEAMDGLNVIFLEVNEGKLVERRVFSREMIWYYGVDKLVLAES